LTAEQSTSVFRAIETTAVRATNNSCPIQQYGVIERSSEANPVQWAEFCRSASHAQQRDNAQVVNMSDLMLHIRGREVVSRESGPVIFCPFAPQPPAPTRMFHLVQTTTHLPDRMQGQSWALRDALSFLSHGLVRSESSLRAGEAGTRPKRALDSVEDEHL
jgi:hypothetical protein